MEPTPGAILLGMVALGILAAGATAWAMAIAKLSFGQPLIEWRPRRPVPWGILDLVAVIVLFLVLTVIVGLALRQWTGLAAGTDMKDLTLGQRKLLTIANMAVSILVLGLSLPLMLLRPGTSWHDFGWSLATLGRDLRLGLIGFVMLAPPVYAIQGALVYYWKPSEHPLMEMFKSTPDAAFFATLVAAAVIVAPLVEEMLFRVFLQGFLEKLASFRGNGLELLLGRFSLWEAREQLAIAEQPILAELASATIDPNPYVPPGFQTPLVSNTEPALKANVSDDQPELRGRRAWLPIAISSIIFALLHYSHGPDWVPLTLLAAGMGYLYQRTHSVIPSLTVHVCLNGLSMGGLWVQVYEMKGAGL